MGARHYVVVLTKAELAAVTRALGAVVDGSLPADHPKGIHAMSAQARQKLRAAQPWAPVARGFRCAIGVATAGEPEVDTQEDNIAPAEAWLDRQPR